MPIMVQFGASNIWRKCEKDGNIFHAVGFYELDGKTLIAVQCPRCKSVTLTGDEKPQDQQEVAA